MTKQPSAARADARGLRVILLRSTFNAVVVDGLLRGAQDSLRDMGARPADVTTVDVPGAFELPLVASVAARSGRWDAIVALGAVIRGETFHFEVVATESARGILDVQLETGVPVANGVLTTENEAQALARKDKGAEAVRVALEMARLRQELAAKWR